MAAMRCRDFWLFSNEWMEGQRSPAAVSHLAGCAACRALISDLELIRDSAPLLLDEAEEPSPRIWLAVKSQLEKEGLIRRPKTNWLERLFPSNAFRPALAGAYLSLLILSAAALGFHMNSVHSAEQRSLWLANAQDAITPVAAELGSAEKKTLPALQAPGNDVTATLNHNLAIVDNMISMCEKGVRQDPQNEMMRDYLYSAYQQKADLLAAAADSEGR